jgi:hypothetical protein
MNVSGGGPRDLVGRNANAIPLSPAQIPQSQRDDLMSSGDQCGRKAFELAWKILVDEENVHGPQAQNQF